MALHDDLCLYARKTNISNCTIIVFHEETTIIAAIVLFGTIIPIISVIAVCLKGSGSIVNRVYEDETGEQMESLLIWLLFIIAFIASLVIIIVPVIPGHTSTFLATSFLIGGSVLSVTVALIFSYSERCRFQRLK